MRNGNFDEECRPDVWAIVKITGPLEPPIYKVLAGWYGGFAGSNSWRINSGIVRVDQTADEVVISGYSGSTYHCSKGAYRTSALSHSVYAGLAEQAALEGVQVEILDKKFALSLCWAAQLHGSAFSELEVPTPSPLSDMASG